MSAVRIPLRPGVAAGLARAAARLCARPRVSLIAAVRRALRCAYLRWRIEHAERDALHMAEQIDLDQRQLIAYRHDVQALRRELAAAQSD